MKKLLSLLFVFTLVACGGSDDSGVDKDPIIGRWGAESGCPTISGESVEFYSNGAWERTEDGGKIQTNSGTWRNSGSDFSSTSQIYIFNYDRENEFNQMDFDGEWPVDIEVVLNFSSDFNTIYLDECNEVRLD